ncbi:Cell surface protein precursor with Cna protein B-type domain and Gram-positive cocci surface proteins LPxTG motif profile [Bifidobacterium cuniculi]|uniref:Cell surface protein with Cna protein B-type domain and Gram-positive cocci surface proteins LPxTG motif profile n=3 Tax=Bifidobacterium cuniculi TaxID=1688 RepID=A0A087AWP3_9BIFI|nr:SpaA isopeptide-forming pilin-related protein [Bifidobacterium cuniculi]KFI63193.1 Cell surface protein precursor with Cna protein B-type domain and Gram-positive cocci surface proteins LPxTG motif profile [Bifidobacterium cuniculi]
MISSTAYRSTAHRARLGLIGGIVTVLAMVAVFFLPSAGAPEAFAADNGLPDGSMATWRDLTLTTNLDRADNANNTDTGVATYVGRDYYVAGKPADTTVLNATNAPIGTYAAEAEGLTVVGGKLAMNPVKNSWSGQGFRFVAAGFGSQFRPAAGKVGLVVAGADSGIGTMTTGGVTGDIGAWTHGGFIGPGQWGDGSWHGPEFAGKFAGPVTHWQSNSGRDSIVGKMTDWHTNSAWWNQSSPLADVNGTDYGTYGTQVQSLSTELDKAKANGTVTVGNAPAGSVTVTDYANSSTTVTYTYTEGEEGLITFTGDGTSRLQVFDLTAQQLNSFGSKAVDFSFKDIAADAPIAINVTGGDVSFAHGWRLWWNGVDIASGYLPTSTYSKQYGHAAEAIMWNFADASKVTVTGGKNNKNNDDPASEFVGSVMVPKGSLDCHVTTNGRVWVGQDLELNSPTPIGGTDSASVINMDLERHNFPWAAELSQSAGLKWNKADMQETLLPGASFAVYGSLAAAKAGDASKALMVVKDGDLSSGDWADGNDGSFQVEGLSPNANYYIRETVAPDGYKLNANIYQMPTGAEGTVSSNVFQVYMAPDYTLADGTQDTMHRTPDGVTTIVDAVNGADVAWKKTADGDSSTLLGGSVWQVSNGTESWTITDNDTSGVSGTFKDADSAAGQLKITDLKPGTYTLKEITPPAGYQLNGKTYGFTIADGKLTWDTDVASLVTDGSLDVADSPTAVDWSKTDGTSGAALAGSAWQVSKWDGASYASVFDMASQCADGCPDSMEFSQGSGLPTVVVTVSEGGAAFRVAGLVPGKYRIFESKVPDGYAAPSEAEGPYYYFTVSSTGVVSALVRGGGAVGGSGDPVTGGSRASGTAIANERLLGAVQWAKKSGGSGESQVLPGSEWKVTYTPADGSGADGQSFTVSDCAASGCAVSSAGKWQVNVDPTAGRFKLENLPWGTYTVKETKAPEGYYLNDKTFTFTVDASTAGTVISLGDDGVITDEPGFVLPDTGGRGELAVVLGGLGIVLVAMVGLALAMRRLRA